MRHSFHYTKYFANTTMRAVFAKLNVHKPMNIIKYICVLCIPKLNGNIRTNMKFASYYQS